MIVKARVQNGTGAFFLIIRAIPLFFVLIVITSQNLFLFPGILQS